MRRSINGSPCTSKSPLGTSVLIGTIRIPKPAARIIAFLGADACIISKAFLVGCISSSIYPSWSKFLIDRLTTPREWPDVSESRL